jgi:hypothetical protein
MTPFPSPRPKAAARNEWAEAIRSKLPGWLEGRAPEGARGAVAGNGAVELIIGATKVAGFLPTSTGLSVYLYGTTDTEVKRIERLCERADVPAESRPPAHPSTC